jgi:hypothetical protein
MTWQMRAPAQQCACALDDEIEELQRQVQQATQRA